MDTQSSSSTALLVLKESYTLGVRPPEHPRQRNGRPVERTTLRIIGCNPRYGSDIWSGIEHDRRVEARSGSDAGLRGSMHPTRRVSSENTARVSRDLVSHADHVWLTAPQVLTTTRHGGRSGYRVVSTRLHPVHPSTAELGFRPCFQREQQRLNNSKNNKTINKVHK